MDEDLYNKGLSIRTEVVGKDYVDRALSEANAFTQPLQELVTTYCWGWTWGREELDRRTRSSINIAMLAILNRPNELRVHLRGALRNGVTEVEIREILLQVGIYGGIPAAVDSFKIAREVIDSWDGAAKG